MMSVLYIEYQRYGTYSGFQRSQNEPVLVSEASSTGSHHPPIETIAQDHLFTACTFLLRTSQPKASDFRGRRYE